MAEHLEISELPSADNALIFFDEASTEAAIAAADRLVLRRWKANARERQRVMVLGQTFDKLRQVLPVQADECHLTRMDVLCRAMEYIRFLAREACGTGPGQPPPLQIVRSAPTKSTGNATSDEEASCEHMRSYLESRLRNQVARVYDDSQTMETSRRSRTPSDSDYSESSFVSEDSGITSLSGETWSSAGSPSDLQQQDDVEGVDSDRLEQDKVLSSPSGVQIRRRMPTSRITVNRQLRSRSKVMQAAFENLRKVVPVDQHSPHLSKAKFLRHTARYIAQLRATLAS